MFNEALRINPAYTEAALNLVVTCNDLGKYAEAKAVYEQAMATSKRAPRELDPFAKGKIANMHAEIGAAYRAVGAVRGGGPRIRAGAGALPDVRRHPHRARQHAPRDGRHDGRHPGARAGARREPALRRRAACSWASSTTRPARREDAGAEWRAVLAAEPDKPRGARCTCALLDPARPRRTRSSRREATGGAAVLTFTAVARRVRRRGDPGLRAHRRRDAHVPVAGEARASRRSTPSRWSRGARRRRRATSATPG